jgi:hypothetical protein
VTVTWGTARTQKIAEQSVIDPPYTQPSFSLASALKSGTTYSSIVSNTAQTLTTGSVLTIGAGTSHDQTVTVSSPPTTTTIAVSSFTANAAYPMSTPVALPEEGFIGVQINGFTGTAPNGVTGIPVQITNIPSTGTGTSTTYYPDSNGCVYEEEMPGNFYVTLGSTTTPPFVDKYENPAPTTLNSATNPYNEQVVSAGSTTIWTATFNQGGTVSFSAPGSVPVALGVPVSVGNSGIPGTNWAVVVPTTSAGTSATLYPFTSAYTAWYGDCLAEEPSSAATSTVTAGSTSSLLVPGLVDLTVTPETSTGASDPVASTTAQLEDPITADNCPSDTFTLPAASTSEAAVVESTRTDTSGVTTTLSSATIVDPSIQAGDLGKLVTGPGIPANSYVGTVTANTSFVLRVSPVSSGATQPASATGTGPITLSGETYNVTVSGTSGSKVAGVLVNPNGVMCNTNCTVTGTFLAPGSPIVVKE